MKDQMRNGLSERTKHHCATGFLIRNMKHEKMKDINYKEGDPIAMSFFEKLRGAISI